MLPGIQGAERSSGHAANLNGAGRRGGPTVILGCQRPSPQRGLNAEHDGTSVLYQPGSDSVESRYPPVEKMAYALVLAARRLRPYFQAHTIQVLTSLLMIPKSFHTGVCQSLFTTTWGSYKYKQESLFLEYLKPKPTKTF